MYSFKKSKKNNQRINLLTRWFFTLPHVIIYVSLSQDIRTYSSKKLTIYTSRNTFSDMFICLYYNNMIVHQYETKVCYTRSMLNT